MLLGIDLGTGSVKALVLSGDGAVLGEASQAYDVQSPQPGWAESQPPQWWSAMAIAVRQAVQSHAEQIQAIGLSGQMHGVVLADATGMPLRSAILWADTRSSPMLETYRQLDPTLQQRLANPIAAGMAGVSLLWLRQHEPQHYAAARWALQPKDWLRLRLTGEAATDPSDASGTLLYDVLGDRWAWEVMEALHLRSDWLPPVIPSSQVAGTLTAEAASALGLAAGLPVVTGAADTAAAALGSGLIHPGPIQLTVGSGAQLVTLRSHPVVDPQRRTHLYRSALPQQWYSLAAIQNAGLALEWVRAMLGMSWSQVYTDAMTVAPGCDGLTFLPYLTGERTPHFNPDARGAWVGLGLHHTRAHLMRAALEGVALALRQGLEALPPTDAATPLRLAGGGTLEPAWRQLLADVLQRPLCPVTIAAASARGAAILAGMGTGNCNEAIGCDEPESAEASSEPITLPQPPDPELENAWKRFCDRYSSLYASPYPSL
jgi:xylulokinase